MAIFDMSRSQRYREAEAPTSAPRPGAPSFPGSPAAAPGGEVADAYQRLLQAMASAGYADRELKACREELAARKQYVAAVNGGGVRPDFNFLAGCQGAIPVLEANADRLYEAVQAADDRLHGAEVGLARVWAEACRAWHQLCDRNERTAGEQADELVRRLQVLVGWEPPR